jgi:hypothetical protein
MSDQLPRGVPKGPKKGSEQNKSVEIKPSTGLKGADQPLSAGNELVAVENLPCELVFLQTLGRAGQGESPSEHRPPDVFGCDAAVEFQPDWSRMPEKERQSLRWRILTKLGLSPASYREDNVYSYEELINTMMVKPRMKYPRFPCVTPSWDNTARRKSGATIVPGSTPAHYERWLRHVATALPSLNLPAQFLFLNARNEGAEGNHLEPCLRWGHGYLKATLDVLNQLQD